MVCGGGHVIEGWSGMAVSELGFSWAGGRSPDALHFRLELFLARLDPRRGSDAP